MTEIRLYFEGDSALRRGFRQFFAEIADQANQKGISFLTIAGGARAKEDFALAQKKHPQALNLLLIDSEGEPIPTPPEKLKFWMVEMMESWFLADPEALKDFYRKDFRVSALKQNPRVEEIPKADVAHCLSEATKDTAKGRYHKTKHAPHILERLDPHKVRAAAPNCNRLFVEVLAEISK